MDLQTFKAPTMAEALGQVKAALGSEAIILHTRTYQMRRWLGLKRRDVVEVTAGRGINIGARRRAAPVMRSAESSRSPVPATQRQAPPAPAEGPGGSAVIVGLSKEMENLKGLMRELATQVRQQRTPQVPEELFPWYARLTEAGVAEDLAAEIVKALYREMRPEHLAQEKFVGDKLVEHLERLLPVAGGIGPAKGSAPRVIALVGPTGVGKTTTIAKLAAMLKLREKRRIGLITMDTYRIAAVDQLRKYAELLTSPLRVANNPEEMREAVASMGDCEFVLIDTAGRSPNDSMKLSELKTFLSAAQPDEVHLVSSTTASAECIELALERFGELHVDKLIFTKLDESPSIGSLLGIVQKVGKPISYVTTGQGVPDDIEEASGEALARRIIGKCS